MTGDVVRIAEALFWQAHLGDRDSAGVGVGQEGHDGVGVGRRGDFKLTAFLHGAVFWDDLAKDFAVFCDDTLPIAQGKVLAFVEPSADFGVIPEEGIDPGEVMPGEEIAVVAIGPVIEAPATAIGLALVVEFAVAPMGVDHRAVMGIEEVFDDEFFGFGKQLVDRCESGLEVRIHGLAFDVVFDLHHQ